MTAERIEILKNKLANYKIEFGNVNGTPEIVIMKEDVVDVCNMLKNDNDLKFEQCVDAVSVDRFQKRERFEMVYNLVSITYNSRLFIRIKLDSKNPEMPSLVSVWASANWYEREAYDMMGIVFTGHPDLRRMYMPEEYEYFPLRKDFPLMGIPGSIPLPNK